MLNPSHYCLWSPLSLVKPTFLPCIFLLFQTTFDRLQRDKPEWQRALEWEKSSAFDQPPLPMHNPADDETQLVRSTQGKGREVHWIQLVSTRLHSKPPVQCAHHSPSLSSVTSTICCPLQCYRGTNGSHWYTVTCGEGPVKRSLGKCYVWMQTGRLYV